MSDAASPIEAWSAYWRMGRSASCFGGADAELAFAQIWADFVDQFAGGARILDLATGNGAAARACAARARARGLALCLEGVDAADIDPSRAGADPEGLLGSIRFRSGVRIESLPYADGAWDGVFSQFGFEYAAEAPAAAETARVLAPRGALRFVMHARESAVFADVGVRLERLERVLAERGAASLVRTLARAWEAGDADTVERESAHVPAALAALRELAQDAPREDAALFYASEFLRDWERRERYRPADLRNAIDAGWAHARAVATRQGEMLRAARTREDVESLSARFAALGLAADAPIAVADERRGAQIAWRLDAHKPAP